MFKCHSTVTPYFVTVGVQTRRRVLSRTPLGFARRKHWEIFCRSYDTFEQKAGLIFHTITSNS